MELVHSPTGRHPHPLPPFPQWVFRSITLLCWPVISVYRHPCLWHRLQTSILTFLPHTAPQTFIQPYAHPMPAFLPFLHFTCLPFTLLPPHTYHHTVPSFRG